MCDKVYEIEYRGNGYYCKNESVSVTNQVATQSCLDFDDLFEYLGVDRRGYGWHISDLKIYDKPKELGEFFVKGECPEENCSFCKNFHRGRGWLNGDTYDENDCIVYGIKPITRPPRSWLYVEEL